MRAQLTDMCLLYSFGLTSFVSAPLACSPHIPRAAPHPGRRLWKEAEEVAGLDFSVGFGSGSAGLSHYPVLFIKVRDSLSEHGESPYSNKK